MGSEHKRVKAKIWVVLAILFSTSAIAQVTFFEGKTIVEIGYEPARQPLSQRDLQRVQLLHAGSPLRAAVVAECIRRMFATGRYSDIQVDAAGKNGGVAIRFLTKSARFIGHIEVTGKISNPPAVGQIANVAQLNLGTPFHPDVLPGAQKSIEQIFAGNGLYEASVKLETIDDPEHQQVNVRIIVNSGKRARYEAPMILGDPKLPNSAIIRATGWRIPLIQRWREVTQGLTRKGIDGIDKKYQKEDRLTASIDLSSLKYDPETIRVKPALEIQAGPKIELRALEARISNSRLKRYVPIYQEGTVDEDLLVEGVRNLRDYFQSKGYPDVDVTFRKLPPEGDRQTIEYIIAQGRRRKLMAVMIRGNRYFGDETIRERMYLQPSSLRLRWGRYSDAFRKRDEETIADLYKSNGFQDVQVSSALQNDYQGKSDQTAVVFTIVEGSQWYVAKLDFIGIEQNDRSAMLYLVRSGPGQPYSDANVAADRSEILGFYSSRGFRHATFAWNVSRAAPHEVNLIYTVTAGNQEFVRDVLITGLKTTRPSVVQRSLMVKPGDPLSAAANRESQRSLYNLGIFAQINTAVQNSDGDTIDKYVIYDFTEAHKYNLNVGVGAEIAQLGATTTNLAEPVGGTGFSPRLSLNLSRVNLWGIGHSITAQTRLSNLEQRAALTYTDPRLFNSDTRALTITGLYDISRDVRTFASHREEASIQLSQRLSRASTALLRFSYRRVSTSDVVIPTLLVPQFLQPVRIGILSGNLVQDRRDNPTDPHRGYINTVDLGLASSIFGSQRTFGRVLLRNATYYRITRNVVLARQLTFGAILPYDIPAGLTSSEAVPLPERFFGGGNISQRGFPENQAGPRDIGSPVGPGGVQTEPTGFPLGGNAVLISNVELRFPLIGENIGGVLFEDAGNVYRSLEDVSFRFHQRNMQDFNYMVHAVGFGIRYKTPIGPIRADIAYSINPPRFEGFKGTVQELLACNPNLPPDQLPPQCAPVAQGINHVQFFFSIGQTF